MQIPRSVVVVRQTDARILRDHIVMDGQYCLRIDAHPGDLELVQIVDDTAEQGVAAQRNGDVRYQFGESRQHDFGYVCGCVRACGAGRGLDCIQ